MTITTTTHGTYTKQFSLSGEAGMSGIISAVDGWLTTASQPGWSLYDTVTSGDGGGITTKVYRVLNKDASTYKYMILRYLTVEWRVYVSCCEDWNTTSNVATNECFTFEDTFPLPLARSNCDLFVIASPRFCIFLPYIVDDPGPWQGVVEIEREVSEDTAVANVPCFAWVHAQTFCGAYAVSATSYDTFAGISLPRTKAGSTGVAAAKNAFPRSAIAAHSEVGGDLSRAVSLRPTYGWDATKKNIHSLRVTADAHTAPEPKGRMFGVKLVPPLGSMLNRVTIPVNADGFFDSAGSNLEHWVLNLQHSTSGQASIEASNTGGAALTANYTISGYAAAATSAVFTGDAAYFIRGSTTTIGKIAFPSGTTSSITASFTPAANGYAKFDGNQYIYIPTTTGILRIDVTNDSQTHLVLTSGANGIAIDNQYVYTARNTTSTTTHVMYRISRSTFTLDSTWTGTSTAFGTATQFTAMCTDYQGNLYSSNMSNAAVAGDSRTCKFDSAGTATFGTVSLASVVNTGIHYMLHSDRLLVIKCTASACLPFFVTASGLSATQGGSLAMTISTNAYISVFALDGRYMIAPSFATANNAAYLAYSLASNAWATTPVVITYASSMTAPGQFYITDGIRKYCQTSATVFRVQYGFYNKYTRGTADVTTSQVLIPR